jgi:hypothetical protein
MEETLVWFYEPKVRKCRNTIGPTSIKPKCFVDSGRAGHHLRIHVESTSSF